MEDREYELGLLHLVLTAIAAQTGRSPAGRSSPTARWFWPAKGDRGMRITGVGRGRWGGGLADLWERAGHEVTRLGRDGGDVSDADAVLVAVPGGAIAEAFDGLRGVEAKTMIDATNLPAVAPPE